MISSTDLGLLNGGLLRIVELVGDAPHCDKLSKNFECLRQSGIDVDRLKFLPQQSPGLKERSANQLGDGAVVE